MMAGWIDKWLSILYCSKRYLAQYILNFCYALGNSQESIMSEITVQLTMVQGGPVFLWVGEQYFAVNTDKSWHIIERDKKFGLALNPCRMAKDIPDLR